MISHLASDKLSETYRSRIIDTTARRLLISKLGGSDQAGDLSEPPNVDGCGRIHHFRRHVEPDWVPNPLPIDPSRAALGLPPGDTMNAEVFQSSACNWRCWYCYVPFNMLAALPSRSRWMAADELVRLYAALPERPPVLDLSGGQPDLTPEWVLWTMEALERAGLDSSVYLWSDDNLSNDYLFRFLTDADREHMSRYRMYGRVGCFKGFDSDSFAFNTAAHPDLYARQFALFGRLLRLGFDLYAYVTFTHAHETSIAERMSLFVDRLQEIDPALPLRTVPLQVRPFGPVVPRLDSVKAAAIALGQFRALDAWRDEIAKRFTQTQASQPIHTIRWQHA